MSIICQIQRLWNGHSLLRSCNIISHSSESLSTPRPLSPPLKQPPHTAILLFDPKPSSTQPPPGAFFHPSPILHIKKRLRPRAMRNGPGQTGIMPRNAYISIFSHRPFPPQKPYISHNWAWALTLSSSFPPGDTTTKPWGKWQAWRHCTAHW